MPGIVGVLGDELPDTGLLERMIGPLLTEPWYHIDRHLDAGFMGARVHHGFPEQVPQPVHGDGVVLLLDGACYGYADHAARLRDRGNPIRTDAEYCLAAYLEKGPDFVRELNGAFVCAIAEPDTGRLLIANDRHALLPLHYAQRGTRLIFGSRLLSLLAVPEVEPAVDPASLLSFMALGLVMGTRTMVSDVHVLAGGTILRFERGALHLERYWDYPFAPDETRTDRWFTEQLATAWRHALERYLDRPYRHAIALSGGFDSRTIVAGLPTSTRAPISTFTLGPADCTDVLLGERIAKAAGLDWERLDWTSAMTLEKPGETAALTDGLDYMGVNAIPKVSRYLHDQGIGDVLIGYNPLMTGMLAVGDPDVLRRMNRKEMGDYLYGRWRLFRDDDLVSLVHPDIRMAVPGGPRHLFDEAYDRITDDDALIRAAHLEYDTYITRFAIVGLQNWRAGVEINVPGFDRDFVDLALTVPLERMSHYRLYRRQLMYLSDAIAAIPCTRIGMVPPSWPRLLWVGGGAYTYRSSLLKGWINRTVGRTMFPPLRRTYLDLGEMLRDDPAWHRCLDRLFLSKESRSALYLNEEAMVTMVRNVSAGIDPDPRRILYLATFELFLRAFPSITGDAYGVEGQ